MMMDTVDFFEDHETREIRQEFKNRGITRLCHLTTLCNLLSILMDDTGILATDFIEEDRRRVNDLIRWDGRTDYISTTIQYPNVWYYSYKKKNSQRDEDWAVIFVDTAICRGDNTLFCPVNAATGSGKYLRRGAAALKASFDEVVDCGRGESRSPYRLRNCPTNDQAEVMIYKAIPKMYFKGLAFESRAVMELFVRCAEKLELNYPALYIAPGLFTTDLSGMIRSGDAPIETKVMEVA